MVNSIFLTLRLSSAVMEQSRGCLQTSLRARAKSTLDTFLGIRRPASSSLALGLMTGSNSIWIFTEVLQGQI